MLSGLEIQKELIKGDTHMANKYMKGVQYHS